MISVYIHIPFCSNICTYCNFSKFYYKEDLVDKYLIALEKEIKSNYKKETIKSLYIGGGTPTSLNTNQLIKLFSIIEIFNLSADCEITIESNVEITLDKIELLYKNKVNRISLGVQTVNDKYLKLLGRTHNKNDVSKTVFLLNKYFDNISVDLIYGLSNQTSVELKEDLDFLTSLNIKHISTYSLIIENNTILKIKKYENIDEDLDYEMYCLINEYLKKKDFVHYETSNYGLDGYFSKHNLTYWNNEEYYGFGLSAAGYINDIRYTNYNNLTDYINFIFRKEEDYISLDTKMEYEMILGLRKIKGVNKDKFYQKYGKNITDVFDIEKLILDKKLISEENIFINEEYLYRSNEILVYFINNFKK